jgi:HK97 family phage portal protein
MARIMAAAFGAGPAAALDPFDAIERPAPMMGAALSDRFGGSDPVSSRDGWFVRHLGGHATKSSVLVTEHVALRLSAVYACVNRIANPIATFPLAIMQRDGKGGAVEVTQHPLSGRIGLRPNDLMSGRTVRKTQMAHALLWGNAYQEIERNGRGEAVALYPLLADRTVPRKVDGSLVFRTNINGTTFELDQENVAHIMDVSQDGYVGLSQIALHREAIGMALAMEEFGGKFFANDAKSGGFLLHPGKLSANASANLRGRNGEASPDNPAGKVERQGGLDNAHRIKVLEEGMKFVQTTIPPEDAQFLGSREFQIAEIARIYDVPLILLQTLEGTTGWGTAIEQLMIGFIQQTVAPWATAIEQEYNWKLFTESERQAGMFVKFNMNAILRGDMAARSAFYAKMFEMGMTINQILGLEDVNGIGPDGDISFVSNNVQTLDRAINGDPAQQPVVTPEVPA